MGAKKWRACGARRTTLTREHTTTAYTKNVNGWKSLSVVTEKDLRLSLIRSAIPLRSAMCDVWHPFVTLSSTLRKAQSERSRAPYVPRGGQRA